jgi:hypothetical protein
VFSARRFSPEWKCLCGATCKDGRTALNDNPEKQRGRPRTSHTDEGSVIVASLIREGLKSEIHCRKRCVTLYIPWRGMLTQRKIYACKAIV